MKKKATTIEDLAVLITKNSDSLEKRLGDRIAKSSDFLDKRIDDLALMTARGFTSVDERFEKVETRLDSLNENIKSTRRDVLAIGDRYVPRYEFDSLLIRFNSLEEKLRPKR